MANQEHLDILAKGVEAWNAWREANPVVKPDLIEADLAGSILVVEEFNLPKEVINLAGVRLNRANLKGANLKGADLMDAKLKGADLSWVNLEGASLSGANLEGAKLFKAYLKGAYLYMAYLKDAYLAVAYLKDADLYDATLEGADLSEATLEGADLSGANLKDADLSLANFANACVVRVKYNGKALYKGIRIDSCYGSQMFKTFAMDQDYIEEFRSKSKLNMFLYRLWLFSSNCGRSMLLWAVWSAVLLAGFAWKYHLLGKDAFIHPLITIGTTTISTWDWLAPIYFSFVTFSTLGFGDIHPVTPEARIWVMVEVMLGYIMLGGLISILANKLARRA